MTPVRGERHAVLLLAIRQVIKTMVKLRIHHDDPGEELVSLIRTRLSACEAASLPTLERELPVDPDSLISGLRCLVKAGRVEELVPVAAVRGVSIHRDSRMRDRLFYRLVRESDSHYEWAQAAILSPVAEMVRRMRGVAYAGRRKGAA